MVFFCFYQMFSVCYHRQIRCPAKKNIAIRVISVYNVVWFIPGGSTWDRERKSDMPIVEKLLPVRGGKRICVILSDGQSLFLNREQVSELGLDKGAEVSPLLLPKFSLYHTPERARDYAAKVAMRPIFAGEMQKKLLDKGFTPEVTQDTLDWLTRIGVLNDREVIRIHLREATRKGQGKRAILYDLLRRGVDRDLCEEALADLEIGDAPLRLLQKKCKGLSDRETLQKGSAYLRARGFDGDEVQHIINQYLSSLEGETENEE